MVEQRGVELSAGGRGVSPYPRRWLRRGMPPVGASEVELRAWCRVNIEQDGPSRTEVARRMAAVRLRLVELRRRGWD